ncbi:hypothetical protein TWF696_005474 [Orbilia brochopaga]|uniref:Uncharacterized protein n=1 Tax=Orbilia brochopaga TaxID=3140254 RepID=A0AAV9V105_9PEZI
MRITPSRKGSAQQGLLATFKKVGSPNNDPESSPLSIDVNRFVDRRFTVPGQARFSRHELLA